MIDNPIVDEVHRIRAQLLAEFDGDLTALIQHMRQQTEDAAKAGDVIVARLPRRARLPDRVLEKVR